MIGIMVDGKDVLEELKDYQHVRSENVRLKDMVDELSRLCSIKDRQHQDDLLMIDVLRAELKTARAGNHAYGCDGVCYTITDDGGKTYTSRAPITTSTKQKPFFTMNGYTS